MEWIFSAKTRLNFKNNTVKLTIKYKDYDENIYKTQKTININLEKLSFKQKILLKLSTNKLKLVKHLQEKLKQAGIYKSAF